VAYRALNMRKKSRPLNVTAFQKESFPYVHSEEVPTLDARQIEIFERLNYERFEYKGDNIKNIKGTGYF
jgi:hypothetical protein